MARNNPALDEGAEEESIVSAIADTEGEIFNEAMGDPDPENDGDHSLEEMEDPVGDDPEETEVEASEDDDGESDELEADEAEGEEEPQRNERSERSVPSWRLREESERRERLERELAELRGQVTALSRQPGTQQQPQAPQKPDKFADPDGHDQWIRQDTINQMRRETFDAAMVEGVEEYGDEFTFAQNELAKLGPTNPEGVRVFQRMQISRDPAKVLMRWAEPRLQEYRENRDQELLERMSERYGIPPEELNRRLAIPREGNRPQQPQRQMGRIPPSLNSAGGNGRTAARDRVDPRGMDGSEAAIFADAFTPLR